MVWEIGGKEKSHIEYLVDLGHNPERKKKETKKITKLQERKEKENPTTPGIFTGVPQLPCENRAAHFGRQ